MAAKSYYNDRTGTQYDHAQQHLLSPSMMSPGFSSGHPSPAFSSSPSSPLKPLHLVQDHGYSNHHAPTFDDYENYRGAHYEDAALKARIRRFRIISRTLAFLISIAVLVPISMTLVKFLQTKDTYRNVSTPRGTVHRTAWARNSNTWPTYMYFAVAAVSVVLNFATIFSYKYGVEKANVASYVASSFSWIIMIGNLVVWSVAASIYRKEKRETDLWGWTCSAAARAIQKEFAGEVQFNQYCNVQSVSWYIGLAQAGAAILTIVIYIMVFMRRQSKKQLQQQMKRNGYEPAARN